MNSLRPVCDQQKIDMVLNNSTIKTIKPGMTLNDSKCRGLQLRAFNNRTSFYLYYRTRDGKERRPKLGDYPTLKLSQAREIARDMLVLVAQGKDPMGDLKSARQAPTMEDLCEKYMSEYAPRKKSAITDQININSHILPTLGKMRVNDIDIPDIEKLHKSMANHPYSANRVRSLLSKMFNLAEKWKFRERNTNPCFQITRYPEPKRKRYMSSEEAQKIAQGLIKYKFTNPEAVAFIYLLIFTGARKSEIANARWEWLNGNKINLPDSKTGEKTIHLPQQAMEILNQLPRNDETITGIKDPTRIWRKIRSEAGCPDLRLHDLRHSFASAGIAAGLTLSQVGELLGHSDTRTTSRYAHLMDDIASNAANETANILENLLQL